MRDNMNQDWYNIKLKADIKIWMDLDSHLYKSDDTRFILIHDSIYIKVMSKLNCVHTLMSAL